MQQFSNNIELFLKNHLGDKEAQQTKLRRRAQSASFRPGDVLLFNYLSPDAFHKTPGEVRNTINTHRSQSIKRAMQKTIDPMARNITSKQRRVVKSTLVPRASARNTHARLVLCVSNQRTQRVGRGSTFISTRRNELLSCFKLENTSSEITSIIVDTLYKNVRLASYSHIQSSLRSLLGSFNYRTYSVDHLSNINEVML